MSNTDPRPPSQDGAHSIYGRSSRTAASRRARWIWIVGGLLVVAVILFAIYQATTPAPTAAGGRGGHGSGARRGGSGGGAPTAVSAARAVRGDMPIYLNELGTVTPTATVTVIPQISGVLQEVRFKEGQMVKKGQLLAVIDPRPYEALLTQAKGTLAKDQAALADARLDLARYQKLLAQDSINSQQVDTQNALVKQDEGLVEADKGAVRTQEVNLIYCHITAPVTGRVGLRQVDPGNYVAAGVSTGIVVITVLDPMDVLFTIPEDSLDRVAGRVRAGAVLPAVSYDRTQTTQLAAGSLLTLDNQVDTTTGTVRAKARFNNAKGALFPNQFVNLRLTVDTLRNAVIVPTSAILKGPNGMFVYTVEKGPFLATAEVTPVTVGPAAGENTAILSGLDAGDVVITDGSDRLKDGSRVVLPGDCVPANARFGANRGGAAGGSKGGGGLFASKPAQDPLAAIRCKPGEKPHSLLDGGPPPPAPTAAPAVAASTASGAPPAERLAQRSAVATPEAVAAASAPPAPAPASSAAPPAAPPAEGRREGGHGGGGMRAIFADLNLDPDQQQKVKAVMDDARAQAQASGDYRGTMRAAIMKVFPLLRPDQQAKLRAAIAARQAQEAAQGGPSEQ